jgi:hypothetical protein
MEQTDPAPIPKKMRDKRMNDPVIVRYSLGTLVASCSWVIAIVIVKRYKMVRLGFRKISKK